MRFSSIERMIARPMAMLPLQAEAFVSGLLLGAVLVEPATCPAGAMIAAYADIPIMMIYGDRIASRGQQLRYADCKDAARQLGKSARFLDLPAEGVRGNGHIMMQEDNSRAIASEIHKWAKSVRQ
jgi:hypothetical protein